MRPRIRTIKPEAFTDEDLWDLEEETGMPVFRAFTGLWCHADREGRFEWRPRPLKAGILPYWEGDFSRVLHALTTRGFVRKYASGERSYGVIPSFTRHQVVNNRETASELPSPSESEAITDTPTREPRVDHACPTRQVQGKAEGKGRERKGRGTTRGPREPNAPPRAAASEHERPPLPKPPDDLAEPPGTTPTHLLVTRLFAERFEQAASTPWAHAKYHRDIGHLATWVDETAVMHECEPEDVIQQALDGFFADDWISQRTYPFGALAKEPTKYATAGGAT